MVEPNTALKRFSKGFYVRMKLSKRKNGVFIKYYKWFLWFLLSLYFFTSFLLTDHNPISNNPVSLSKIHISLSKSNLISHALFETNNPSLLHQPHSRFNDIKIYVYDLPPKYNVDWLSDERCSNHLFASEVAIHRALLISDVRTFDPYQADFFFVPVYVSCNFSSVNGFPVIGRARFLMESAVNLISSEYPFWNRTWGSDHVFVASHDFGACFHAMGDLAVANGIPEFLKKSIILQTFGVKYDHPCQDVEKVVIPPYISPESVRTTTGGKSPAFVERDIFAFFRGKMEVNPKNISGRFYSRRVRTLIYRKFNGDRRFYLKRHRFAGYQSEILRSIFCLCPLGWAPWSPRLVESVALGCVPVIIADGIRLPFSDSVNWPEISLTVAEKDVGKLGKILAHVASTNLSVIQKNLWDPRNTRALLYDNQKKEGDATWHVIRALSLKVERSYKRLSVSSQWTGAM